MQIQTYANLVPYVIRFDYLNSNRQPNNARFKVNQSYARLILVKNLTGTPIIIAGETGKILKRITRPTYSIFHLRLQLKTSFLTNWWRLSNNGFKAFGFEKKVESFNKVNKQYKKINSQKEGAEQLKSCYTHNKFPQRHTGILSVDQSQLSILYCWHGHCLCGGEWRHWPRPLLLPCSFLSYILSSSVNNTWR